MNPIISILIPAYKKVEVLSNTLASFHQRWSGKNSFEFMILANSDDTALLAFLSEEKKQRSNLNVLTQDKFRGWEHYGRYLDLLAVAATGDFLMDAGNDTVMMTDNWDVELARLVTDPRHDAKLIVLHSYNGSAGGNSWPVLTRSFYEATGSVWPGICGDLYLCQLADTVGATIQTQIEFKHEPTTSWTPLGTEVLTRGLNDYRSEEGFRRFERDKARLGLLLQRTPTGFLPNDYR